MRSARCELETDHAGDDQGEARHPEQVRRLTERRHADDHRPRRTDPGPQGIGGPERDRPQRDRQQGEAQGDRHEHGHARPEPGEAVGVLETERPADLQQAGEQKREPSRQRVACLHHRRAFSSAAITLPRSEANRLQLIERFLEALMTKGQAAQAATGRHVSATEITDKSESSSTGPRMLQRISQGPTRVRTLFLSDIHLGTKGCQADRLLDFLRHYEADVVYLVGDIVDGWQLKSGWYWPQIHNDVVQKLLRQARKGARLRHIPGNHDEFLRDYYGTHFGGIEVLEDAMHVSADGKRYLVIHGDLFDVVIRHARWLALLGNRAYDLAIWLNTYFNTIRRALGLTYWSLSQWAKLKVKNAVNFIGEYERALAAEARRRGVDGVICGHIHHAVIRNDFGLAYINCGDWVESCTAVVEHFDGRFEIVRWVGRESSADGSQRAVAATPAASQAAPDWRSAVGDLMADLTRLPLRSPRGETRAEPAAE